MNVEKKKCFQLGIIGGLGPLASATFIDELYRFQTSFVEKEQDYLRIICISDPGIPDRTQYFSEGRENIILTILVKYCHQLLDLGCDEIVILCFTTHAIFHKFPKGIQSKIHNLVTITLEKIIELQKPVLLLRTSAARKFGVFEKNSLMDQARKYLINPTEKDQEVIHKMIYQLKLGKNIDSICEEILRLIHQYQTSGWVAGCTDFSLLYDTFTKEYTKLVVVDPMRLLIQYYTYKYVNTDAKK